MKRKILNEAKFILTVVSEKGTNKIKTLSIFDNRKMEYLSDDFIEERNIRWFLDINDAKETLNWNLNGDSSKYQFKWGFSGSYSEGRAYVFN